MLTRANAKVVVIWWVEENMWRGLPADLAAGC